MFDFFLVHVAGADRADQDKVASPSQREDDKNTAVLVGFADADEPLLIDRMLGVRKNCQRPLEETFDTVNGKAVLLALVAVAVVPIELKRTG